MLARSVLLVLIVILSNPQWTSQLAPVTDAPFVCDTYEKKNSFDNLAMMAYSYITNNLYLFLKNKHVIYFKAPKMMRKENRVAQYGLIVGQAFESKTMFGVTPRDQSQHIIGHLYSLNDDTTDETKVTSMRFFNLYLNAIVHQNPHTLSSDLDEIQVDGTPGKMLDDTVDNSWEFLNSFKTKKQYLKCWINFIRFRKTKIVIDHTYCNETSYPPMRQFVMWLRSFNTSQPLDITTLFVTADKQILMSDKKIEYKWFGQNVNFVRSSFEVGPIPLTEFMSCPTTIRDTREVSFVLIMASRTLNDKTKSLHF